jgi:hypothetical protein
MRARARWRLVSLLVAAACLYPQTSRAQVSVSLIWHQPDIQAFYLSDFTSYIADFALGDPESVAQPDLFTVQIVNTTGLTQRVFLKFFVFAGAGAATELLSGTSDPFSLAPEGLIIRNSDLIDSDLPFGLTDTDFNEQEAEDIATRTLETGTLPSDTYTFRIEVYAELNPITPIGSSEHIIVVTNPTRVDLVGPGGFFGELLPVVANSTPQFFWSADAMAMGGISRFRIKVVQVEESASAEDAMDGFAVWQAEMVNQTTEIYPASVEAIPLEPGATYAWQVARLVETSGGTREIESDIFWFRMEDEASGIVGAGVDEEVNSMIQQIAALQGLGADLEDFQPTGQVLVDGRPVSLNSLRGLLSQVLTGAVQIATIIIR